MKATQTTDTVLMVRPAHFQFNAQTATSNAFQTDVPDVQRLAVEEFDQMAQRLRDAGIHVVVITDSPAPVKPDAIFPNNWMTTHSDGTVVLYPMAAPNRRLEVRPDVLEYLEGTLGYEIRQVLDLTPEADRQRFLEGTGSLVLDRVHRVAYACLSPRTNKALLEEWAQQLNYTLCVFHAVDRQGQDIYHTNVMMSVGHTFAVVCLDAVPDAAEREALSRSLTRTGHELVTLTLDQVYDMAGNMLLLHNTQGTPKLVMSQRAHNVLTPAQISQLQNHCELLPVAIPHIEIAGGGSARCMLAEVFLPRQ
jgi:hypothetical protein